ncbi:zinc finger protein 808-like isoform X2 [Penaeus chinensis]|uniref:zinc finger protein 808-like isoform X2 n=1 Tax=Penaeus chinensis TaxID=139456 RepID=UPI001FB583F9|nr:zinc finger protein 808-like isoform X2 [Penaeus chinensis]
MSSEGKVLEEGREEPSHETPQAITITIMDPSALETTTLDPTLVTSMQAQDTDQGMSTLLVMPREGHRTKDILQTVTETHMGTQELPVISSISNTEEESQQSTIQVMSKSQDDVEGEGILAGVGEAADEEEGDEGDDLGDPLSQHCLICNFEMATNESEKPIPVFKSQTSTTHRKMAVFLGTLVGQKLTSRKAHSDIICRRCFNLLDKVDALEVEIRDTKEEIITKFQETVTAYGGRARRRKPATAKKSDYVFPKVEPEEDILGLEMDENFEPRMEDLLEEEQDHREDRTIQDEEWEPEFKRPKIKREPVEPDPNGPPKRKRGRPRKDASKPKAEAVWLRKGGGAGDGADDATSAASGRPACPVCGAAFSFQSQLRRHVRYEHPNVDAQRILAGSSVAAAQHQEDLLMDMKEDAVGDNAPVPFNLSCIWCDCDFSVKEAYDEHLEDHNKQAYQQYLEMLLEPFEGTESVVIDKVEEQWGSGGEGGEEAPTGEGGSQRKRPAADSKETDSLKKSKTSRGSGQDSLKCEFCGFSSLVCVSMERHMDKCHDSVTRQCRLCGEQCMDAASLKVHLVHHFNGVMTCPVCPVRFSIRSHLLAHLELCHNSGYAITCSQCNLTFNEYENFEAHEAREHGHGGVRVCELCLKEVLAFDFHKHMLDHEDAALANGETQPHACNLCRSSFMFATQLYRHKYKDHPESFAYKCDECERKFRTEWMLLSHKWGHKYGSHQCPACKLKFRQVDQLKRHLLGAHPEVDGFCCKYCPITLKNYSTYVQHLKFKHPKEAGYDKRPVRCKICGESFAHKVQWKYHMRNHSQAMQTCEVCGITVKNLEIHMNLHTKEKKYECQQCGAVYHNKASFHFHMKRVHMGQEVRKHICHTCKKGFLTPADLRIHLSRVHHGERNYWCTTCSKGYKSKVSLTYHQRLHTGERPHQCTLCGRSFRVPSYLKRHMEHDHRAQYPGVYFKQGRPKSQEQRGQPRRRNTQQAGQEDARATELAEGLEDGSAPIPEIVQITVPMEMGGEVISAVGSVQDLGQDQSYDVEQDGVVYVVYES